LYCFVIAVSVVKWREGGVLRAGAKEQMLRMHSTCWLKPLQQSYKVSMMA